MVYSDLIGGIGNNMFQYAIARIFADKKGYNLQIKDIGKLNQYFKNVVDITDRFTNYGNPLHIGYNSTLKTVQYFNTEHVFNHIGEIHFSGFFQKLQYYKDYLELLKYVFHYNDDAYSKPGDDDLVVHVRLGDYKIMNWFIYPEIFAQIIDRLNLSYNKCIIITDEPGSSLLDPLRGIRNSQVISQSLLEDFTFIKHAKKLIISQSTFSWWAALLGEAERIYVPVSAERDNYPWKINPQLDDIDLIADDRFVKIHF